MLDKEFVPYQESLELKGLEFDEPCFVVWPGIEGQKLGYDGRYFSLTKGYKNSKLSKEIKKYAPGIIDIAAPTFSQAFRWFRKKYGLVIQYIPFELDNEEGQSILHHKHKISEYDSWRGGRRNTIETELCDDYEEAELACLRKLIEIVKK